MFLNTPIGFTAFLIIYCMSIKLKLFNNFTNYHKYSDEEVCLDTTMEKMELYMKRLFNILVIPLLLLFFYDKETYMSLAFYTPIIELLREYKDTYHNVDNYIPQDHMIFIKLLKPITYFIVMKYSLVYTTYFMFVNDFINLLDLLLIKNVIFL